MYEWYFPGSDPYNTNASMQTRIFNEPGDFVIKVKVDDGVTPVTLELPLIVLPIEPNETPVPHEGGSQLGAIEGLK
jgi:hypothetical protein